ncbi:MAG: ectonucleotide pyrophosphatase/phosphodiesterase [Edaphobacter sp.]|uniref:alkaline phosphatase family protein n=1 Tax=Edaphobacter sp. TaxID=1934404 RepID=UPI00238F3194|nr:ectonucleotide pyrophosphatase/phosphodiesterase [Edaphobacter sp.]MDE1177967.1 ectonucleotide pyrophosphatase/phosphodiesterase [Edaphobacter sp.]
MIRSFTRFAASVAVAAGMCVSAQAKGPATKQVILISVDGMTPMEYTDAAGHGLKIPNISALRDAGCSSPGMLGVFPASTYPSHTAMITGQPPGVHGIVSNTPIDPMNLEFGGWYYYAEKIKTPTLWEALHDAHLKTAAVSWPVTVGAKVDYLLPEYRPVRTEEDVDLMHVLSTPGLFAEMQKVNTTDRPMTDAWRTDAVIEILRTRKPSLLALHLSDLDEEQHRFGPHTPQTHEQLETIDAEIGKIRAFVEQSGRAKETTWIIVSDHGFTEVAKLYQPLVALREAGLITTDKTGRVTSWKVYTRNSTGSFFLEAKDRNDHESIEKATKIIEEAAADPANGIAHVYTPEQIKAMGGDPDAFLAVDPVKGFGFGNNLAGPKVTASAGKGAHGFNPEMPEMHPSFILSGAGIAACKSLEGVTIEDVGPTAAALLGAKIPGAQGRDARTLEKH